MRISPPRVRATHLLLSLQVSKFLHEGVFRWEAGRLQEVEQAEELLHGVLERRSRQQDLVLLKDNVSVSFDHCATRRGGWRELDT